MLYTIATDIGDYRATAFYQEYQLSVQGFNKEEMEDDDVKTH